MVALPPVGAEMMRVITMMSMFTEGVGTGARWRRRWRRPVAVGKKPPTRKATGGTAVIALRGNETREGWGAVKAAIGASGDRGGARGVGLTAVVAVAVVAAPPAITAALMILVAAVAVAVAAAGGEG